MSDDTTKSTASPIDAIPADAIAVDPVADVVEDKKLSKLLAALRSHFNDLVRTAAQAKKNADACAALCSTCKELISSLESGTLKTSQVESLLVICRQMKYNA